MDLLVQIKNKMFFYTERENKVTLFEFDYINNRKNGYNTSNYQLVKIGEIFNDFVEILFLDIDSKNVVDRTFYLRNSIIKIICVNE